MPTYAAFPNLAWQAYSFSSNDQRVMSNYYSDGRQSTESQTVKGLEEEMIRSWGAADGDEGDGPLALLPLARVFGKMPDTAGGTPALPADEALRIEASSGKSPYSREPTLPAGAVI